ncbi:MAG TPA: hypothetical protein VGN41_04585, partial [Streptosporangiaceae bacterium]
MLATLPALAMLLGAGLAAPAYASAGGHGHDVLLEPGNLLVSGSVFQDDPNIVAGKTVLPPGCTSGCATAVADGTYPQVFNNDLADASFGVTSKIMLDELTPSGSLIGSLPVPAGGPERAVTSFSS